MIHKIAVGLFALLFVAPVLFLILYSVWAAVISIVFGS